MQPYIPKHIHIMLRTIPYHDDHTIPDLHRSHHLRHLIIPTIPFSPQTIRLFSSCNVQQHQPMSLRDAKWVPDTAAIAHVYWVNILMRILDVKLPRTRWSTKEVMYFISVWVVDHQHGQWCVSVGDAPAVWLWKCVCLWFLGVVLHSISLAMKSWALWVGMHRM